MFRTLASHLKSDFIKKIVETCFSQLFTIGISFISVIFFSRILGPTARGMLATSMAIMALGVQFGNIGLHAANAYFVAKDRSLLSTVVGNSCIISLVLGTLISLFVCSAHLAGSSWVPIDGWVLYLTSLLIPIGLAHLLFQNILLGIQEVRTYNKIEIFIKIFIFLSTCFLFFIKIRNIETILIVNLLATSIGIYFTWRRIQISLGKRLTFSFRFLKMSLVYGLRSYVAAFFCFLVIRIDLLMVKHILNFEQAGYYSIAANMADIFSICPAIIGALLFPRIVSITDEEKRFQIVKKTAIGVFLTVSVLGIFCALSAKIIILTLLGEAFLPAVPAFLWLVPGLICLSVNVIFMNYFASIGIPWIMMLAPALATFANIAINFQTIPSMGISGASISSTICYSGMLVMSLLYLWSNKKRSNAPNSTIYENNF